jgi:hypothetical protein
MERHNKDKTLDYVKHREQIMAARNKPKDNVK